MGRVSFPVGVYQVRMYSAARGSAAYLFTPLFSAFFTSGQLAMQVDSAMKNEGRFN